MKQYSTHCEWDHKMNEYKINEIFLHTDGKVYQCMEWDHYQKKESEYSRKEQECAARMLRDGYDIDDIF